MKINLSENQMKAIKHQSGPMMVLAGPGSGKTTVITYRIKYLIKRCNIRPSEILVITFTKAAATEMKNRYNNLFGDNEKIYFATFHSLFFKILNSVYNFPLDTILQEKEKHDIIKKIIRNKKLASENEENFINDIINEISLIKNDILDIDYYNSKSLSSDNFKDVFFEYEEYKKINSKIDFDDMLSKCYHLISNNPKIIDIWRNKYKYILIDEFQDINKVQFETIRILANPINNIFIVGDDDQSIYKFRGARPEFLLKFPEIFKGTKKIILDINHRSTEQIIQLCNKIISQNKIRYEKGIRGQGKKGKIPVCIVSKDISNEAEKISQKIIKISEKEKKFSEIAVVYRNNIQARSFMDMFRMLNIPFHVKDEVPTIYDHFIAKDILAYLKLSLDKNNNKALERIINKPTRYISNKLLLDSKKIKKDSLLEGLYSNKCLKYWQFKNIEGLMFYLNAMKQRETFEALKYLRKAIGYDDYLKNFANYLNINPKGLFEILDEIQESAKNFININDYLKYTDEIIELQKNKKVDLKNNDLDSVTLSTLHSIKGLEYDYVFISSVIEGVLPSEKSRTIEEIEEECRLLYVGMTRARKELYLSILKTRYENKAEISRFLKDII